MFEWCTRGWRGDGEERARCARIATRLAPLICIVYAFGFSVIAFDQVMSLSPTWYSNLFGAYFSWGGFLSAVALTVSSREGVRLTSRNQPVSSSSASLSAILVRSN